MEALSICDCIKGKPVRYFCVTEGCLKRRLCADCNRVHQNQTNHDIRQLGKKNSLSTLSLNKDNRDRDLIVHQLINTLNVLGNMKEKMIVDATQFISTWFDEAFKEYIEEPIQLIAGTKDLVQQIKRKELIHYQRIENYQLDKIAKEVRDLNHELLKSLMWIRELCQDLKEDFSNSREDMTEKLKLAVMESMKELTPLDKIIRKVEKTEKYEKERAQFLKRFQENVIGWGSKHVSTEEWMKSNKLENIQDLSLGSKNMTGIPPQLSLFPNLKRLSLSDNKIKKIQNLSFLKNLQILYLGNNKIQQIEGLEFLTKLNTLSLNQNNISEIKGLDNQINLQTLLINYNQIKKLENLEHLTKLKCIFLNPNPLEKTEQTIKMLKKMKANGLNQMFLPEGWNI